MAIGQMTRKQLDKELAKGIESIKDGKLYSADEVDAELAREFGIWNAFSSRSMPKVTR